MSCVPRQRKALFRLEEKKADDWSDTVAWKFVDNLVGYVRPKSGTIQLEGQQEQETVKYEVMTPWRPDVFTGQAERRMIHADGRNFYVESVLDVDESHKELQITCTVR
jgi:SPP1 family predicted phage head-tail adaptor